MTDPTLPSTEAARWTAPWTDEQVTALNAHQTSGRFHPYTCGVNSLHPPLVASFFGWSCAGCDYRQDWAHAISPEPVYDLGFGAAVESFTVDVPSTEAVGEVRREVHESCAAIVTAELEAAGWVGPKAIEVLFEQRDTAIAEAQALRERVRVAGSESRRLIAKAEAERDDARNDVLARDYWARDVVFHHELDGESGDDHFATVAKHLKRARAERDQAIADLAAFSQEVARLYEVEREAERMRKVVEAAKAWALAIFGEDWVQIPGDEDHYGATELALAEAVDVYTKEAGE